MFEGLKEKVEEGKEKVQAGVQAGDAANCLVGLVGPSVGPLVGWSVSWWVGLVGRLLLLLRMVEAAAVGGGCRREQLAGGQRTAAAALTIRDQYSELTMLSNHATINNQLASSPTTKTFYRQRPTTSHSEAAGRVVGRFVCQAAKLHELQTSS